MKRPIEKIKVKGRFLGIFVLVIIQFLVGFIHIFLGSILLLGIHLSSIVLSSTSQMVYSLYTLIYGILVTVFTYLFWKEKRTGWIGTAAISIFIIIVDILAIFDLLNFLSIPKMAGLGEIPYSLFVLFYLFEHHIRLQYKIEF